MHNSGEGGGGGRLDLQELPEGCIANVISLTTPADACRLSLVSRSFLLAAESDAVWGKLLPPDIPSSIISKFPTCRSKSKDFYLALCHKPVLIEDGKMSFQLDKLSGKKCYMISARNLSIVWADTPAYWRWISHPDSRFEEVAELLDVCWLEIRGKMNMRLLSSSTLYKAYLVFKFTPTAYGFRHLPAEVTVGLLGGEPTRQTMILDTVGVRIRRGIGMFSRALDRMAGLEAYQSRDDYQDKLPKNRPDGWLEIEFGGFFCAGGDSGELEMTCLANGGGHWKSGLIVQGIEVRPGVTTST